MESASSPNSPSTTHPAFVRVFGTQGSMRFSSGNSISFIRDLLSLKEPLLGCPWFFIPSAELMDLSPMNLNNFSYFFFLLYFFSLIILGPVLGYLEIFDACWLCEICFGARINWRFVEIVFGWIDDNEGRWIWSENSQIYFFYEEFVLSGCVL